MEGLLACSDAEKDKSVATLAQAQAYCQQRKQNAAPALNSLLNTLEPGGPRGAVQIGYTVTLQLLALFTLWTPSGIVVKEGTPFTGAASLKGKKIGVLKGSTQEKYALGELKTVGVTVVPYEAQDQVYLDIKSGRLDGTVADRVEVTGGFLSKPEGQGYGFVGPVLNDTKYFGYGVGVALRQGETELKDQLNAAIKAIRANGTYDTVAKKYFDFDVYGQ